MNYIYIYPSFEIVTFTYENVSYRNILKQDSEFGLK